MSKGKIEVRVKLSPLQAGKLLMQKHELEEEVKKFKEENRQLKKMIEDYLSPEGLK